jgi:hypothetical protein
VTGDVARRNCRPNQSVADKENANTKDCVIYHVSKIPTFPHKTILGFSTFKGKDIKPKPNLKPLRMGSA